MDHLDKDNQLMAQFGTCSEPAYNQLFHKYKNILFDYVYRSFLYRRREDCEDVVQDTLKRVCEYKYKYVPKFKFSTWVYTIAHRLAINKVKQKKYIPLEDIEEHAQMTADGSVDIATQNEREGIVANLLNSLKPKYKEVVVLRLLHDLKYDDISKVTATSENTLKSRFKRAMDQLRKVGKEFGLDENAV